MLLVVQVIFQWISVRAKVSALTREMEQKTRLEEGFDDGEESELHTMETLRSK